MLVCAEEGMVLLKTKSGTKISMTQWNLLFKTNEKKKKEKINRTLIKHVANLPLKDYGSLVLTVKRR